MSATIHIFTSSDTADRATALELEKALAATAPDMPMAFWQKNRYTDTEYRAAAKTFLETARLFIIVHSGDYETSPDTRFEMELALSELVRRPGGLFVVIVPSRTAVIPPRLQGFCFFPDRNESIEGLFANQQLVRTAYQLAEFLRTVNAEKKAPVNDGRHIPLTLPDLQERLHEMSDRFNLTDVLQILKALVHQEQLSRAILQAEDDFLAANIRNYVNLDDFQRSITTLKGRIATIIDGLNDDFLLRKDWRALFLDRYRKSVNHRTTAFYFPLDEIRIPETRYLAVNSNNDTSATGQLTAEQQQEFRRQLLLCQDAINVEKYAAAHGFCDQVRTKIDPQSAQLYEYLLITFVKKESPVQIIRRLLDEIPSGFNYVKLYSDRYYQYQNANPPICPSETGVYNLKVAVEELAAALHSVYSTIPGNAVCHTGELDDASGGGKAMVAKSLEALTKLYHSLSETQIFVDTMIIELVGGGKYSWLDRIVVKDSDISFISNASFDLKGKVDELLGMLENADMQRVPPKQREMIREDLFWGLLNHCGLLAEQVREEQRLGHVHSDLRRSVIRIVQACVAGHYLLTRPGDVLEAEKSLLRLAIELLVPQLLKDGGRYDLPRDILLDWFTLNDTGQLILSETSHTYRDFDALAILKKIIGDHAGQHNWPLIAEDIRKEVWLKYVATSEAIYEKVQFGLQWTDFRRMNELDARKQLIDCLRRRWTCHLAYPDESGRFPNKIVDELAGNGLLQWFVITPRAVNTHPDCLHFHYDSKAILHQTLSASQWSENAVTAMLIGNLHQKTLLPAYALISSGDRGRCAEILGAMLLAFKSHPVPLYLDAVYHELITETKFKWVEVDLRGQWYNASDTFDAVGILEHLADLLPVRFPIQETTRLIADNRWKEQVKIYETEVSLVRHENRLPERLIVAAIIRKLKGVFQFCPDLKYLQIPFEELRDNGRIRWYERTFGIFKSNTNHHENHHIHFDIRAERLELKLFLEKTMQHQL